MAAAASLIECQRVVDPTGEEATRPEGLVVFLGGCYRMVTTYVRWFLNPIHYSYHMLPLQFDYS